MPGVPTSPAAFELTEVLKDGRAIPPATEIMSVGPLPDELLVDAEAAAVVKIIIPKSVVTEAIIFVFIVVSMIKNTLSCYFFCISIKRFI